MASCHFLSGHPRAIDEQISAFSNEINERVGYALGHLSFRRNAENHTSDAGLK